MDNTRSKLFDDFDVSEFKPAEVKKEASVARSDVKQVAEAAGFRSRESKVIPLQEKPATAPQRRRRTGRNAQLNLKARPETIAEFTAIADKNGWGLGEAFEKAVELLKQR